MNAKLELKGISKKYGPHVVIRELSLTVDAGEFFVVLGPSGGGKSTLLKQIAGIETPDSGRVIIDGDDVTDLPPNKRNIAMVFQSYALYPNMNVFNNIAFPLKMRHVAKEVIRQKVEEVAHLLNISQTLGMHVARLSGGQQQRVALARAMVRNPSLFLLDEPLSNLDARTRFAARGELQRIQRELKQTFVYVTHDQKEAASLSDRVGVLHQGTFEQIATFQELYDKPSTKWVGDFVGDFPMNFLPAKMLGLDEPGEVGFRPEWIRPEQNKNPGNINCTVQSIERVGDAYYMFCSLENETKITIKDDRRREIGAQLSFSVSRYNLYPDSRLNQTSKQNSSQLDPL
jgi:ABC-type sugar transport system ATPase subunit